MASLTYSFDSEGLSQLRSEMQDLAAETRDVGEAAQDAASDLEDMGDTDAAEDLRRSITEVQDALEDLADEATDTGASLEQGLDTSPIDQLDTAVTGLEGEFEDLSDSAQIDTSGFSSLEQRTNAVRQALEDLAGTDVSLEQIDAGPLENVSVRAEDARAQLEDMAGTDAGEAISGDMDAAERSISDVGEEAQEAARRLREEFDGASDQALEDLTGLQDRLDGLQDFGMSIGGGDITADITSQLEDFGGVAGNVIQGTITGGLLAIKDRIDVSRLGSLPEQLKAEEAKQEVADLAGKVRELQGRLEDMAFDDAVGPEAIQNVEGQLEDVKGDLEDATRRALRLNDALTLDDLNLDDIELNLPKVLGQTGPRDPYGGVEESAESAEEDVEGLSEKMSQLAEAAGLGGIADQLGNVASKARAAFMAFGPLRGSIIAATAAVGTLAPKMGQLARELQSAAANASRLPSEIQKVANAQEILTGRRDAEQVGEIFKEFNLRMREAQEGSQEAQEGFQRLGITMQQLGEKTPNEAFQLVLKRLRKASKEQRALSREQVLGGQAAEQFALMTSLSAEQLERLMNLANETSFADEQIARFAAMGREIDSIGQRFRKLGGELLGIFEPVISTLLKSFDQLLRAITFVFDKIEDYVREAWGMLQDLDSELFGTERFLEFSLGGEGTESEVPADEGETGSNPTQRFRDVMKSQAFRIARIRQRAEKGLISEEEMLRQIVSARESTFRELQKIGQKAPDLFTEEFINHVVSQLKAAQRRLEEATASEGGLSVDPEQAQPAGPEQLPTGEMPTPGIQQMPGGLSSFRGAAKAADSVGDINSLIEATKAQFDTLNNKQAQAFIARLQKAKEEMQEAQTEAELIGDALARSVARSADRVFDALGQGVADSISAIFGGGSGRSTAQARLNLFNAKEQVRSLRKSLRQGNMSYRKFALRMKVQQNKIQQRQEQLNDSMQSGFAQAAESMVSAFKQVAKQLIAEITAVVAKMLVLKAITSAFSIGSGGFLGSVITNLGGGAFLDSGASGGMVKQSGLAVIHENEQIMNAETVSMLDDLLQPSTPSAQPAMTGGGGMNVTVNVTGQTTTDGRDLKTAYDQTTRIQRRKGRRD